MQKRINGKNKKILIIGDIHFPANHPSTIPFLEAIKKKYRPDIVISIGDEVNNAALGFHNENNADIPSASDELKAALKGIKQLEKLWPNLLLASSNHGDLAYRRAQKSRMNKELIKDLKDVYGTPKWEWFQDFLISSNAGPIYVTHGKTSKLNGLAQAMMCNTVQGHFHGRLLISHFTTAAGSRWDAYTGCLVDDSSFYMDYGKNFTTKSALGSILIDKNGMPHILKLNLKSNGKWDGKL